MLVNFAGLLLRAGLFWIIFAALEFGRLFKIFAAVDFVAALAIAFLFWHSFIINIIINSYHKLISKSLIR